MYHCPWELFRQAAPTNFNEDSDCAGFPPMMTFCFTLIVQLVPLIVVFL
jgi:hypothetical protein